MFRRHIGVVRLLNADVTGYSFSLRPAEISNPCSREPLAVHQIPLRMTGFAPPKGAPNTHETTISDMPFNRIAATTDNPGHVAARMRTAIVPEIPFNP